MRGRGFGSDPARGPGSRVEPAVALLGYVTLGSAIASQLPICERASAKAASVRSTSSSLVCQFDTEIRIAARPSHVVPLIHASPLACTRAQRIVGLGVGGEADQHLIQLDVVEHLGAEILEPGGEAPRVTAAALDEIGDARRAPASGSPRTP